MGEADYEFEDVPGDAESDVDGSFGDGSEFDEGDGTSKR